MYEIQNSYICPVKYSLKQIVANYNLWDVFYDNQT